MLKLHGLAGVCALIACAGVVAFAVDARTAGGQQPRRDLPEEAIEIIESVGQRDPDDDGIDVEPPCCVVDEGAPSFVIPQTLERLEALTETETGITRRQLESAVDALESAWHDLNGGTQRRGDAGDLGYLRDTLGGLRNTVLALEVAAATSRQGAPAIRDLQSSLASVAGRMATDVFAVARSAGVAPRRLLPVEHLLLQAQQAEDAGRYVAATTLFDTALGFGTGTIDFDIDAFEQNILDTLDGETIGHTYAITLFDTLYVSDGIGDARLAPDPNPVAQDADKRMHVASVSKTLTAALVMWLLEENGLTPDDPIGPWLPPDWELGDGVYEQTFRDFMTHESGIGQKGINPDAPMTYDLLEDALAIDVPFFTTPFYHNANYAIFRVIVPRLAGFDLEAYPEYTDDELTAGLFVYTAISFYEAVDVYASCLNSDLNPTLYYGFPHNDFNGYAASDYAMECGGYGFYLSSNELGAILADLAVGDDLLSDDSFDQMKEGFLGFLDPANGYPWSNGGLGVYHSHSGIIESGTKGMWSCVMFFPNGVTAALQINSLGGDYPHQCEVLRAAFDAAWVPG